MRSGWKRKPLGALLSILNGYAFDAKAFSAEAGMPLIRIRDLKNGFATQTKFDGPFDQRYVVQSGSFLVGMDGEFGCFEWQGPEALLNQRVCKLHSFVAEIDPRFLFYGINKHLKEIEEYTTFTTVKHLSSKQIASIEFDFPALEEQRRIVAVLDKSFAGIATATANAQKNLANARELLEAALENTFSGEKVGWETKPFSELCTIKHGFAFKSEFFGTDGDYVLLTPGNFYETGGYRDRGKKQKFYNGEAPPDFILEEGDLLVAMTEQADGLLGSPIIVPNGATFLHNQRLGLVEPRPGVAWCADFFFHAFNTKAVRLTLRKTGTGAKVRHTSPTKIGDVKIAFPKTEAQQRQVAARLTAMESKAGELCEIVQRKLAALTALKQSLLQKAFAGELT